MRPCHYIALVPPKEYNMFEFDEEIKNGIRPGFLEKVCSVLLQILCTAHNQLGESHYTVAVVDTIATLG